MINCYSKPSRLFITGGKELNSSEGTTQGDPISMAMYAIGIMPLMTMVMGSMSSCIKQIAFADDLTGIGTIDQLKEWWDLIIEHGPYIGYYVNVDKSWLICKQQHFEHAEQIFADSPIGITIEGRKHLGAVIGSVEYKNKYLHEKVRTWIAEVEVLGEIAKSEPHAAYTAFTHGLRHKYNYVMRTIPNISDDLKPLDDAIRNTFIKAVFNGYICNDIEMKLLALPIKFGGMGIVMPSEICDDEYQNSLKVTEHTKMKTIQQEMRYDHDTNSKKIKQNIKNSKRQKHQRNLEMIKAEIVDETKLRALEASLETCASSWLSTLPIRKYGFNLNKQTFWDGIYIRYNISIAKNAIILSMQ